MTKVIIMAGGRGMRLRPLTDETPKPMLLVNEKPMLEWIIRRFAAQGFNDFVISLGYLGEKISDYFVSGKSLGVKISYMAERDPLGTAGALGYMKDQKEDFIVINGDVLVSVDYGSMLKYHESHNALITIGASTHSVEIPYGVLDVEGSALTKIREKPVMNYPISAGVYVMSPGVLKFLAPGDHCDMPDLIRSVNTQFNVAVFPISGDWADIGTHHDYERAIGL